LVCPVYQRAFAQPFLPIRIKGLTCSQRRARSEKTICRRQLPMIFRMFSVANQSLRGHLSSILYLIYGELHAW
jgi:hypothetical protein